MEESLENHECGWRTIALELKKQLEAQSRRIEQLERMLFGKRSEKMPKVLPKSAEPTEPNESKKPGRSAVLSDKRYQKE